MAKKNKLEPNKADTGRKNGTSAAAKAALAILGVGFVAGTTLVVGMMVQAKDTSNRKVLTRRVIL